MRGVKAQLKGLVFGRLSVLDRCNSTCKRGNVYWKCLCECGSVVSVSTSNLKSGRQVSCGCYKSEVSGLHSITHGDRHSITYSSWMSMKSRCNSLDQKDYGGRGIGYDPAWECYEKFLKDMGERPSILHSIERVDVNKGYSRDNCKWTDDRSLQSYNQTVREDNKSGRTGVSFRKNSGKWRAYISVGGRNIHLGSFESFQDAVNCREEAEVLYYGFTKGES